MPRLAWSDVAEHVRSEVADGLGSAVVGVTDLRGGFSPGAVAHLRLADGRSVFVKAVSADQNPDSCAMTRHERTVADAMPADLPVPRLRHAVDDGHWVALVYDHVAGRPPVVPWTAADLELVVDAMAALALAADPCPIPALESASDRLDSSFSGWRRMAERGVPTDQGTAGPIEPELLRALDRLVVIEEGWVAAAQGTALVHLDLRSDNLLVDRSDRVWFVDWAHGAVGAPWVDLAFLAPSVAMEGGPNPEELWRSGPYAAVDDAAVTAVVAAIAGFFTYAARLPPPPGLPTIRAFQEAQGVHARRWLLQRL